MKQVRPHTMTSDLKVGELLNAINYVTANSIPGAIVECGVWKGGSMMMCAYTLNKLMVSDRNIYMYDTYKGMQESTDLDMDYINTPAHEILSGSQKEHFKCFAPLYDVQKNVYSTGYSNSALKPGLVRRDSKSESPSRIQSR